jgi:hypothetical protein
MNYTPHQAIEILQRTPAVLKAQLSGLDDAWILPNEGPDTFSPYDVVGHMLHGEITDWRPRIERLLAHGTAMAFDTFDRFAMYEESKGKSMNDLLSQFDEKRKNNIEWFVSLNLQEADLNKEGMHPKLGVVTLRNLLSTWVIHDLTHIAQINRVMAKQLKTDMGPWQEYFRIIHF